MYAYKPFSDLAKWGAQNYDFNRFIVCVENYVDTIILDLHSVFCFVLKAQYVTSGSLNH